MPGLQKLSILNDHLRSRGKVWVLVGGLHGVTWMSIRKKSENTRNKQYIFVLIVEKSNKIDHNFVTTTQTRRPRPSGALPNFKSKAKTVKNKQVPMSP